LDSKDKTWKGNTKSRIGPSVFHMQSAIYILAFRLPKYTPTPEPTMASKKDFGIPLTMAITLSFGMNTDPHITIPTNQLTTNPTKNPTSSRHTFRLPLVAKYPIPKPNPQVNPEVQ
jgi:hypothetical protein